MIMYLRYFDFVTVVSIMSLNFPTKRRSTLGRRHLRTALLSNSGEKKPVSKPTLALPTPGRGGLSGRSNGQYILKQFDGGVARGGLGRAVYKTKTRV